MSSKSAAAAPGQAATKWLGGALAIAEPLSVAGLFIFMLWKSWLRWPDPLVDFPRDLYMAWRISQGALLYDQLANWYGPLAQLVEAAGFRIFGVGMDTIFWMNIALTTGILLLLRAIMRAIGNRLTVWLCSVVFILVFAFGLYRKNTNYTFIAPYSAQATYAFAGLLLVLWALLRHAKSERKIWLMVAGWGLALAYLDKHEPLIAGLGALGIYLSTRAIRLGRHGELTTSWLGRTVGWLATGFFCLWTPVFLFLVSQGGLEYGFRATNRVPYTMFDPVFIHTVSNSYFMKGVFGLDHPWSNFLEQAEAGGLLVLVCAEMALAAWVWTRAGKWSAKFWIYLTIPFLAVGAGYWLNMHGANHWVYIGRAIVFPVLLAAAAAAAWSCRAAWRDQPDFAHRLGVAMVGVAGSLMLARMVLYGRITDFGFFMAPLSVCFIIHVMVVEVPRLLPEGRRKNWLLPLAFSLVVLSGTAVLGRVCLSNYAKKTLEIGEGRDHFYTFEPKISAHGLMLKLMMEVVKQRAAGVHSLVAFPEAIALNYHLRVPSPLAETEFQPVSLAYVGPQHVLEELKAHPPEIIFLHYREMDEFGVKYFGADEASGSKIWEWLNENYQPMGSSGQTPDTITGHVLDLYGLTSLIQRGANSSVTVPEGPASATP